MSWHFIYLQGKYDRYCVFWDGLKTLVNIHGIAPSKDLLLAYKQAENRQHFGPDIQRTLQILKANQQ